MSPSTTRKARGGQGRSPLALLDEGKFLPVYLLLTDDLGLADEFIGRLRAALVDPGLEPFDLEMLSADELDLEEARQKLRQLPVGPHRLVVIRDLARQGADGPVYSALKRNGTLELCRELASVQPPVHVVVTALPKKELDPIFKETGIARYVVKPDRPSEADLLGLMRKWASARKLKIDPDAAHLLIDIAGESTGTLKSEVEKLATCCPEDGRVTAKLVQELAGASREFQLRDYVDRVLERDPARAIPILRGLEEWGEDTPKIISWLVTGLLGLVAAKSGGHAPKRVAEASRSWSSVAEINLCLQQLYRVNRAKMTGKGEDFARLELFTLCAACRTDRPSCALPQDGSEHELCMRSRPRRRVVNVQSPIRNLQSHAVR